MEIPPELVKQLYALKNHGFSFEGNSIYNLIGTLFGKQIRLSIFQESPGQFSLTVNVSGIQRKVFFAPTDFLDNLVMSETRRIVEVSYLSEMGFHHKILDSGEIICEGQLEHSETKIHIPVSFPEDAAKILVDGVDFTMEVSESEYLYTKLENLSKFIEIEKDKRRLKKRGFTETKKNMLSGTIEEEKIHIKFPENYPASAPSFILNILHPTLTDDDGVAKIESTKPIYWKKNPNLEKILEDIRVKIERVRRMVPRLYMESFMLIKKTDVRPNKGNLDQWVGILSTLEGNKLDLVMDIPRDFPNRPPQIYVKNVFPSDYINSNRQITHPIIDDEWKESTHLFEIIDEIKQFKRTDLTNLTLDKRLEYEHYFLEKYEPSIELLTYEDIEQLSAQVGKQFYYGWKIVVDGEGVLLGRKYTLILAIESTYPNSTPVIKFESDLDVTERILLFGSIDSKTGLIKLKTGQNNPGNITWDNAETLCELLEKIKEKLRVKKYELTSSESFFTELAGLMVADSISDFYPLNNDLNLWRGSYKAMSSAQLKKVHYEVRLSQNYPLSPPRVTIVEPQPFINPNVSKDGIVNSTFFSEAQWKKNDLKEIIKRVRTLYPEKKKSFLDKILGR